MTFFSKNQSTGIFSWKILFSQTDIQKLSYADTRSPVAKKRKTGGNRLHEAASGKFLREAMKEVEISKPPNLPQFMQDSLCQKNSAGKTPLDIAIATKNVDVSKHFFVARIVLLTTRFHFIALVPVPDRQIWQLCVSLVESGLKYEPSDTLKITTNYRGGYNTSQVALYNTWQVALFNTHHPVISARHRPL